MKIGEVKSMVHDLIYLDDWRHPLNYIWVKKKYEIDLLTGRGNLKEEDSVTEQLAKKREWFKKRVRKLKGNLKDFEKAKIVVYGAKEKVDIIYRGKPFQKEFLYGEWIEEQRKLKGDIAKLKPTKVKLK